MNRSVCSAIFFLSSLLGSEEPSAFLFKGRHFLASYYECDHEALTDLKGLEHAFRESTGRSGATILAENSHIFEPEGFSMIILLSESHASLHTYPEYDACFIDLFTCGDHCSAEAFECTFREYLNPKSVNVKTLERE